MARDLSEQVINELIHAGKCIEEGDIEECLLPIRKYAWINTKGHKDLIKIAKELSHEELVALIRSITLAENRFRWIGGSVAAVIYLYRVFRERFSEDADAMADWILRHTQNIYLPYGNWNLGARSLEEYRLRKEIRDANHQEHLRKQEDEQRRAKKQKEIESQQRAKAAEDRKDQRQEFLETLSRKPLEDQLWQLAKDEVYSHTYYPTNIANTPAEIIGNLDTELKAALLKKLSIKCRGPWGKFKKRLKATT